MLCSVNESLMVIQQRHKQGSVLMLRFIQTLGSLMSEKDIESNTKALKYTQFLNCAQIHTDIHTVE